MLRCHLCVFLGYSVLLCALSDGDLVTYYCSDTAEDVADVFCNDKNLMPEGHDPIKACRGRPALDEVCQHDGRLYATTTKQASCQFEGKIAGILSSNRCEGIPWLYLFLEKYNIHLLNCVDRN